MARFCQRCGTPAGDADRFCGTCGNGFAALDATAAATGAAPASTGDSPPAAGPTATPAAPEPTAAAPAPGVPVAESTTAPSDQLMAVYRRVGEFLRAGDIKFMENTADQTYTALYGSAVAIVKVIPAGTDDTWVAFLAPVVSGATIKPDLLEYLLRKNADWAATKFHLSATNEIWLQYSILGSILDAKTCKLAIAFTMLTADAEDDTIRARWGGKRASEVMLGVPA